MAANCADFVCQLRRHSLARFGQRGAGVLASDAAHRALADAVAGLLPPGWTGDDWLRDVSLAPDGWPWLPRRLLALPQCIGTASLAVYLLVDGCLVIACTQAVRLALAAAAPDFAAGVPHEGQAVRNWFAARRRALVIGPIVFLLVALLDMLVFRAVAHWLPWLRPPPTLLTLAIVLYGASLSRLDGAVAAWDARWRAKAPTAAM